MSKEEEEEIAEKVYRKLKEGGPGLTEEEIDELISIKRRQITSGDSQLGTEKMARFVSKMNSDQSEVYSNLMGRAVHFSGSPNRLEAFFAQLRQKLKQLVPK